MQAMTNPYVLWRCCAKLPFVFLTGLLALGGESKGVKLFRVFEKFRIGHGKRCKANERSFLYFLPVVQLDQVRYHSAHCNCRCVSALSSSN
jgi:hypothetical protein